MPFGVFIFTSHEVVGDELAVVDEADGAEVVEVVAEEGDGGGFGFTEAVVGQVLEADPDLPTGIGPLVEEFMAALGAMGFDEGDAVEVSDFVGDIGSAPWHRKWVVPEFGADGVVAGVEVVLEDVQDVLLHPEEVGVIDEDISSLGGLEAVIDAAAVGEVGCIGIDDFSVGIFVGDAVELFFLAGQGVVTDEEFEVVGEMVEEFGVVFDKFDRVPVGDGDGPAHGV